MGDDKYVRLNDDKVVLWLRAKLNQIADLFELSTKATQLGLALIRAQAEGYMASKHDTLTHGKSLSLPAVSAANTLQTKCCTLRLDCSATTSARTGSAG